MSNRKQRRRRAKDFRHDVRVFEVDGEGNEVAIAELRERDEKPQGSKTQSSKSQPAKARTRQPARGRTGREPPVPSWDRAIRRGGLMGGLMLIVFVFLFKSAPIAVRLAWGLFYAIAFVPLTYWIDRTAYRSFQKRQARQAAPKK